MTDSFDTKSLQDAPVVKAPDGSTVRPLCRISGAGSFAHFQLEAGDVSKAVSHATVQELVRHSWRRGDVAPAGGPKRAHGIAPSRSLSDHPTRHRLPVPIDGRRTSAGRGGHDATLASRECR